MDMLSVAAASISLSTARTGEAASIALLKDSMDAQQQQTDAIIRQLGRLTASFGHQLDITI